MSKTVWNLTLDNIEAKYWDWDWLFNTTEDYETALNAEDHMIALLEEWYQIFNYEDPEPFEVEVY